METYCTPILSIGCRETERQGWSGKCNLGNIFLSAADSVEHHAQVFLEMIVQEDVTKLKQLVFQFLMTEFVAVKAYQNPMVKTVPCAQYVYTV